MDAGSPKGTGSRVDTIDHIRSPVAGRHGPSISRSGPPGCPPPNARDCASAGNHTPVVVACSKPSEVIASSLWWPIHLSPPPASAIK
jgi:hypothetical protein